MIERETDEKRRLQTIIQQLPVGVLITDSHGTLVQRNKQIDSILGISLPQGFKIGKDSLPDMIINGKTLNPSKSPLARALSTGRALVGKEMVIQYKDNKPTYIQVSASPIRNKSGKVIAAASIITDITPQKELEKRKDDFINMASHELKTPLTSMKLYLDILAGKLSKTDEQSLKIITSLKSQTDKLQDLVNDLLDVSRVQTGKLNFNTEVFRLDTLLHEIVDTMQNNTQQPISLLNNSAVRVRGDRFRIYQVVTNLLTNAMKYSSQQGNIVVTVKKDTNDVIVSVQDNGIGIDRSQHNKIFDRLYQVTDDKEKTFPGLGMGLYISKEIIKRHKGRIWVESEKGKGSTFYFSLPLNTLHRNKNEQRKK